MAVPFSDFGSAKGDPNQLGEADLWVNSRGWFFILSSNKWGYWDGSKVTQTADNPNGARSALVGQPNGSLANVAYAPSGFQGLAPGWYTFNQRQASGRAGQQTPLGDSAIVIAQQQTNDNIVRSFNGNGNGGGNMNGNGSFGGGFNIGQLLAAQQVATAISTLFSANQSLLVGQTTAPTKGPFAMAILQGMALGLGQSGGASAAGAGSSQTSLLLTLLGTSTFTSMVTALNTYNAILGLAGATFTTIANGHNAFLTTLSSILSTISNNNLIATLGTGDNGGSGAMMGVLLQQTANSAFLSANPQVTVPFTTTTMDSAFSALETSFLAWLNSAFTNALLGSALGA